MTKLSKKQNDILGVMGINHVYSDTPINRTKIETILQDKHLLLENLVTRIKNIENCELEKNAKNIVFSDGDKNSPIMIVGEGPGQKEDELSLPFIGEAGQLLNKMLKAINIYREKVYITNVVNYRPPNNRKPETKEIERYSEFLREHIYIINPKILILLGSTAMEALLGNKLKITKVRGIWRKISIHGKDYKTIVTFHPAYLLRQPEQKKLSWLDLKEIRREIDNSGIKI